MYLPKHFEETDNSKISNLIENFPLGNWVNLVQGRMVVNHIPFLLETDRGEKGVLTGHLAKANRIWKTVEESQESLVTFQGPHSYITPSWYPTKAETGEVVPTWNYLVAHVYGTVQFTQEKQWLLDHVTKQTALREQSQSKPWSVSDAPEEYIDKMLGGIVGIEISITHILAKRKYSQNKSNQDQRGVAFGLGKQTDTDALDMSSWITESLKKD